MANLQTFGGLINFCVSQVIINTHTSIIEQHTVSIFTILYNPQERSFSVAEVLYQEILILNIRRKLPVEGQGF